MDRAVVSGLAERAMTLAPLLAAPLPVIVHAVMALAAFLLGGVQLALPKDTLLHRWLGRVWVAGMMLVAGGSFLIHTSNGLFGLSWIHGLSLFTLIQVTRAVMAARAGRIRAHIITMLMLYTGALVIAGGFTLMPGRIMHKVVFGG